MQDFHLSLNKQYVRWKFPKICFNAPRCRIRQSIVDGRIREKGEKSISLILTGADVCNVLSYSHMLTEGWFNQSSIGSNECTLEPADQQTVETLVQEARTLSDEINGLVEKKKKKEKSKAKKKDVHIQQYNEQVSLKNLLA